MKALQKLQSDKFIDLKDEEINMQFTWPTLDIDAIEAEFEELGFESMLKQNYISSYEEEFLKLEEKDQRINKCDQQ